MTVEELNDKIDAFWDSMPATTSFPEQLKLIHKIKNPVVREHLYVFLGNVILNRFIMYKLRFKDNSDLPPKEETQTYINLVPFMPKDNQIYYEAVAAYFKGDLNNALKLLKQDFAPENGYMIDEYLFGHNFLVFIGVPWSFWDEIIEIIKSNNHDVGVIELAHAVQILNCSGEYDNNLYDALTKAIQANPDSSLANELLGFYYLEKRKYANTAACFEHIQNAYTIPASFILFYTAWCYGKTGDHKSEIDAYQRCLTIDPYFGDARNNLGYAYYQTRQYQKAEKTYKECIDMEMDLPYACSNYVLVLAALGKFRAARQFIKKSPYKIRKYALDRLEAAESGKTNLPPERKSEAIAVSEKFRDNLSQFSNEKLLEDELEARLRNGSSIFGVNLKIYKRTGIYGQQFIIPAGRLDLLAEDDNGCLYVIELKKDSGYDDAFNQIKQYIDYLEKSELAAGKPVKGIICLSNPTQELIEAVRSDDRISLFEYQISYTKII